MADDDPLWVLDEAVRAHAAGEHPGQLVIGWALVVATTERNGGEDATRYDMVVRAGQPAHHTAGLLALGTALTLDSRDDDGG